MAAIVGVLYALAVFAWAARTGVTFPGGDPAALAFVVTYAFGGIALLAAVPLYLLGRLSLVSPAVVWALSLANTVYQRWYLARPHDALASYLVVWPLVLGGIAAVAVLEAAARIGLDRWIGRLGLRRAF